MPQPIETLVEARYLVASLGESASPPWWRTEAMSPASMRILARLFPRTFIAASLETASRAAGIEHDQRIGRVGAYHLFRLPTSEEMAIRDWLRQPEANDLLRELAELGTVDARTAKLSKLAGPTKPPASQGPVHCGVLFDLRSGVALQRICGAYLSGFTVDRPVYPYVTESPH